MNGIEEGFKTLRDWYHHLVSKKRPHRVDKWEMVRRKMVLEILEARYAKHGAPRS